MPEVPLPIPENGTRWTLEQQGNTWYLVPWPDQQALAETLNQALGPERWSNSLSLQPSSDGTWAAVAEFQLQDPPIRRAAIGTDPSPEGAAGRAMLAALEGTGILTVLHRIPRYRLASSPPKGTPPGPPERFAEDLRRALEGEGLPEEVEVTLEAPGEAQERLRLAEAKTRELIRTLKERGLGPEAARIVAAHPKAFEDLEKARELYRKLQELLKRGVKK